MGWFTKSVGFDEQLARLAEAGLRVNAGVTHEDLCAFGTRKEIESKPYEALFDVLGIELEREPWTPICDRLWMCDLERVEDHGAYREVLERLERMTGNAARLAKITDFVDVEGRTAWAAFESDGREERWKFEVEDDWLDPSVIKRYDDLLDVRRSETRLWVNTLDYGQAVLLGAFTPEQKAVLERLRKTGMKALADVKF
jgi:hypothetical protein